MTLDEVKKSTIEELGLVPRSETDKPTNDLGPNNGLGPKYEYFENLGKGISIACDDNKIFLHQDTGKYYGRYTITAPQDNEISIEYTGHDKLITSDDILGPFSSIEEFRRDFLNNGSL